MNYQDSDTTEIEDTLFSINSELDEGQSDTSQDSKKDTSAKQESESEEEWELDEALFTDLPKTEPVKTLSKEQQAEKSREWIINSARKLLSENWMEWLENSKIPEWARKIVLKETEPTAITQVASEDLDTLLEKKLQQKEEERLFKPLLKDIVVNNKLSKAKQKELATEYVELSKIMWKTRALEKAAKILWLTLWENKSYNDAIIPKGSSPKAKDTNMSDDKIIELISKGKTI